MSGEPDTEAASKFMLKRARELANPLPEDASLRASEDIVKAAARGPLEWTVVESQESQPNPTNQQPQASGSKKPTTTTTLLLDANGNVIHQCQFPPAGPPASATAPTSPIPSAPAPTSPTQSAAVPTDPTHMVASSAEYPQDEGAPNGSSHNETAPTSSAEIDFVPRRSKRPVKKTRKALDLLPTASSTAPSASASRSNDASAVDSCSTSPSAGASSSTGLLPAAPCSTGSSMAASSSNVTPLVVASLSTAASPFASTTSTPILPAPIRMGEEGYETGAGSTRMRRGGKGDSAEVTSKGATSKGATGKMPKTYGRRKTLKTYGRSLTGPLLPSGDREGAETQECGAEMDIDSDGSQQQ